MAEVCINCGATVKTGLLSTNCQVSDADIEFINLAHATELVGGCEKCARPLLNAAPHKISQELKAKRKNAEALLSCLPLASIHSPHGWSYRTLGLVTAQTVSGTGLFSDVTSAFTDLFGAQSGAYNHKLRSAEESCRSSLRAQAFQLGGNAVVGVDVDYAEVGGTRAMLMVCMTGTAIEVDDPSMLGAGFGERLEQLRSETVSVRELTAIARKRGIQ